jgi:hydroxymethylpyrimidine pyrophosphatase-like HAD family hydrolase
MRIFFLFILLSVLLNLIKFYEAKRESKSHLIKEEEFPEISDEEIIRAKQRYASEQDIDQKGFLEPVTNPEKFDLNYDEKISKAELREAINWMVYSKDPEIKRKMKKIMTDHVTNSIDVYVRSLNFEFLNLRQFSKLMSRIHAPDFINEQIMMARHLTEGSKHREPAIDL